MGWNPTAGTTQLSSQLPYDTGPRTSITNLCDEIGGDTFGFGSVHCAVKTPWTQLFDAGGSMSATCATLGGKSFGHINQFCAVEGVWSQLRARLSSDDWYVSLSPICKILDGTLFGSGGGSVCAVRGIVSQLTTKLPGDSQWQSKMTETCSKIGGHAFSRYCAVNTTAPLPPTPPDTPPTSNTNADGGLGGGAVAGIVIGSISGIALLSAIWFRRARVSMYSSSSSSRSSFELGSFFGSWRKA